MCVCVCVLHSFFIYNGSVIFSSAFDFFKILFLLMFPEDLNVFNRWLTSYFGSGSQPGFLTETKWRHFCLKYKQNTTAATTKQLGFLRFNVKSGKVSWTISSLHSSRNFFTKGIKNFIFRSLFQSHHFIFLFEYIFRDALHKMPYYATA